ncbi:MAG: VTT domain-containing protein [Alphaproteobacteria bacterium]|nr:VTT domain-containing protein [Alphaproteobacteria bacterium]
MTFATSLASLLHAMEAQPVLQFGAIVAGTFILEDATSVLAALAAASGYVPAAVALAALYVGIALGDAGLYALGRLASTHPWARRYVRSDMAGRIQRWLAGRLATAVIATRFLPGMRLPTYTTCGFLSVPFARFMLAVIAATLVWTSLVFGITYRLGNLVGEALGVWRWPIGLAIALAPLAWQKLSAPRHARQGSL